jgi:hypothetical protein
VVAKQRRTARTVAGRKAKGRQAVTEVRDLMLTAFIHLSPDDVYKPVGTVPGPDLHLSAAATRVFPYSVEVKKTERLAIWEALKQAEANANGLTPALFFTRNNTRMYVAIPAEHFVELALAHLHYRG